MYGDGSRQGAGAIRVGDKVGVLIDTEGEGRVLFFKNGKQSGPGFVVVGKQFCTFEGPFVLSQSILRCMGELCLRKS
jgi:hypothetical protein